MEYETIFRSIPQHLIQRVGQPMFRDTVLVSAVNRTIEHIVQYAKSCENNAIEQRKSDMEEDGYKAPDSDEDSWDGCYGVKRRAEVERETIPDWCITVKNNTKILRNFLYTASSIPVIDMDFRVKLLDDKARDVKCLCPFSKHLSNIVDLLSEEQKKFITLDMTCPKPGLFNHSHALSQHLKATQGPNSAWCHLMYSYFLDQLYPDLNKSNQHNR